MSACILVLHAGTLLQALCPGAHIVRGPLNRRSVIPQKLIVQEPEKYAPALAALAPGPNGTAGPTPAPVPWRSLHDLAALVNDPMTTSVVMDMFGAAGFVEVRSVIAVLRGTLLSAPCHP